MRIFKTKAFVRFARKEGITDAALLEAVAAADIKPDADLGGGVIKQRVARQSQGKSGDTGRSSSIEEVHWPSSSMGFQRAIAATYPR